MGVVSAQQYTNAGSVETGGKGSQNNMERLIVVNHWEIERQWFLIHCPEETKCASMMEHCEQTKKIYIAK